MKKKLNVFYTFDVWFQIEKKKIDPKVVTNINLCFEHLRLREDIQKNGIKSEIGIIYLIPSPPT